MPIRALVVLGPQFSACFQSSSTKQNTRKLKNPTLLPTFHPPKDLQIHKTPSFRVHLPPFHRWSFVVLPEETGVRPWLSFPRSGPLQYSHPGANADSKLTQKRYLLQPIYLYTVCKAFEPRNVRHQYVNCLFLVFGLTSRGLRRSSYLGE